MNLPGILLLFALYTLVVAGVVTLIYFTARRPRPKSGGLPIPNVTGLKLKPVSEENIVAWPARDQTPSSPVPGAPAGLERPATIDQIGPIPAPAPEPVPVPPAVQQPAAVETVPSVHEDVEPEELDVAEAPLPLASGVPAGDGPSVATQPLVPALSAVFTAANSLLPEGLRTLTISPSRAIEPGGTVGAVFTFRNLGGGTARGFRVRFNLPEGLGYHPGSAHIDDVALENEDGSTPLLEPAGADIGEVPAGGERRIAIGYAAATTIENGTHLMLQAAVGSADVAPIGSNIVKLVVHSRPILQNESTTLELAPVREISPGEELLLTVKVTNSGQSSAHDLMVLLPLPSHTSFLPNSVNVDGRPFANGTDRVPFGFARPTVVRPILGPGASVTVSYRVRIDTPLEDGTRIVASGAVCSQEVPEFSLSPVIVKVPSAAAFSDEGTALWVESDDIVDAGERVRLVLHAKNVGTAPARKLALRIALPEGMVYTAGSLAIDGATAPDRNAVPETIRLGDLEPGQAVEMALSAVVHSPIANGSELRVAASVAWSKGQRTFEHVLRARSAPRFPVNFNKIEHEAPRRVGPGEAVAYTVSLLNMGTDVASDVRLKIEADEGLEELRVQDRDARYTIGSQSTIALDTLEPGVSRLLRIEARIARVIEDQRQLRLSATLQSAQLPRVDLGTRVHLVDSRPVFSTNSSRITAESNETLRFKRLTTYRIALVNEGTDCGRGVRVNLVLPEELRLETVEHATREGDAVVFGDIPAGETREALVGVRLVGIVGGDEMLTVSARVGGINVVPFALAPLSLATHAEASFVEDAKLTSVPSGTIDAGAEIAYTLSLRNGGDGVAKRLTSRIANLSNAVYAQGSTSINSIALQDIGGTSPLLHGAGLVLADVGAGVEVVIRWRAIVNTPLPPDALIEASANVAWDDAHEIVVVAVPVSVHSTSALPLIEPRLPFSVVGAVAAPTRSTALVMRGEIGPQTTPSRVEYRQTYSVRNNAGRQLTGPTAPRAIPPYGKGRLTSSVSPIQPGGGIDRIRPDSRPE